MHTIVVGGGFAGVKAALELAKQQAGRVTLISERPYFLHHGLLYAAAVGLDREQTAISLDDIFASYPEVTVVEATMTSLDPDRQLVVCGHQSYRYDALILALGSQIDLSSLSPQEKTHIYDSRSLEHIERLRTHIHTAIVANQPVDRPYVIVGGGTTGVELAGILATYICDMSEHTLSTRTKLRVIIAEQQQRLLPDSSKEASRAVTVRLSSLGVECVTGVRIDTLGGEYVTVGSHKIATDTIIWATGVINNPFYAAHPQYFTVKPNGLVAVNPYLEAYRDIYVIGDNVDVKGAGHTRSALDMAIYVADQLLRRETGRLYGAYRPVSRILSVPVGNDWAYVECLGIYIKGRLGRLVHDHLAYRSYLEIMPRTMADIAVKPHTTKKSYL